MNEDRIRITVVPRKDPDIGLYVLALIALARRLQEQEAADKARLQAEQTGTKSASPAGAA